MVVYFKNRMENKESPCTILILGATTICVEKPFFVVSIFKKFSFLRHYILMVGYFEKRILIFLNLVGYFHKLNEYRCLNFQTKFGIHIIVNNRQGRLEE